MNNVYNKVLVPLDGSDFSECSLEHVKAIVTGCKVADVVLLWAIEPVPPIGEGWPMVDFEKAVQDQAKDYLARMSDKLKKEGLAVQTAIVKGRAADAILDYARKNNVDLIIMSTHGRSGVSRWVMGSVTDKVVRHATIPVLTVSPPGCRIK